MKHYRILEKKTKQKQYKIQYQKSFLGLYFWKSDKRTFGKYDNALTEIKNIIKEEDYEKPDVGYHYIDAYKIFKAKKKDQKYNS